MELWDFGSGGGDLAEGFNLRSTSPFPLPEDGEERRGRPRKKRVRNRAARLLLNFTEARVYGTQTGRKIDSLNLKMCPEKLLVYSLAALLLPLAGCNRQIHQERTATSEPGAPTVLPFSALGDVGGDRGRATSPVVTDADDGNLNITETRATLGRTARLECTAQNISGKKMVSWVRYRDTSLLAVGKFVYVGDDRFRVIHEPHAAEWYLAIQSVSYADEGVYECQINSKGGESRKQKSRLTVVEPRTEILGEHELYVDYASSLNLTCLIHSPEPPAYVFWKKDDKLVDVAPSSSSASPSASGEARRPPSSNVRIVFSLNRPPPAASGTTASSLLIARVNASHSGVFSCIPSNSRKKSIRLHVLKDDSKPAAIHTTTTNGVAGIAPSSSFTTILAFITILFLHSWKCQS